MNREKLREQLAAKQLTGDEDFVRLIEAILDEDREALTELAKSDSGFPLKDGDGYWFIDSFGEPYYTTWEGCGPDLAALQVGNVFLTEKDAQAEVVWRKNQHALMCEADGGNWWARNYGKLYMRNYGGFYIEHAPPPPNYPAFSTRQDCELAYYKVLKNSKAIKAHLTYQSKAVKFMEVV